MRAAVACVMILMMLTSCSFTSDDGEHEKGVYPDMILYGASYTLGQSGENPIFIDSAEMALYSKDSRAVVEDISFVSYDDEGNIALEGSAEHGEIDTEEKTMDLSGSVRLSHRDGNMMIEADMLFFDSGSEEIEADGHVHVSSDDGVFTGTGFKGDLREEAYSFNTIEQGVFEI